MSKLEFCYLSQVEQLLKEQQQQLNLSSHSIQQIEQQLASLQTSFFTQNQDKQLFINHQSLLDPGSLINLIEQETGKLIELDLLWQAVNEKGLERWVMLSINDQQIKLPLVIGVTQTQDFQLINLITQLSNIPLGRWIFMRECMRSSFKLSSDGNARWRYHQLIAGLPQSQIRVVELFLPSYWQVLRKS